jgi:hypothetical protein
MVSLRVLLPAGVLMGLLAGCARSTGTAMYGVRGANGVIVIKTKRPDQ